MSHTPRDAQMNVRSSLATPRMRLAEMERMLHDYAPVAMPQAEAWARELEEFAERLTGLAGAMRRAARCGGFVQGVDARRPCRLFAGHVGMCAAAAQEEGR